MAASRSKSAGSFDEMSSAIAASMSSPPPAPPPTVDCVSRMAVKSSRVSLSSLVIAAFGCNPKTSGEGNCGSARSAAMYSSCVSALGCAKAARLSAVPVAWNE